MLTWQTIERAIDRLVDEVRANPALAAEFEESRREFFALPEGDAPEAQRRHREWFLLERPSLVLAGVPAAVLEARWAEDNGELSSALLQSLPGVFAVTTLVPGEGLWVHDLATQGEHPVVESDASTELQPEDVLVGRMYPVGGGLFRLSPAMAWFRSPMLVRALRADFERQRSARRGVLRIAQLELERLFHGVEIVPGAVAGSPRAATGSEPDVREVRQRSHGGLVALGLDQESVARLLRLVRNEARKGHPQAVTELLNRLAFDTDVDLVAAQCILVDLWQAERRSARVETREASVGDAEAALASFDRGRAQGQDLEKLFRKLERDLGVDDDEDEEDAEDVVPDFPGVIGAMVEEFLWDVERERGDETAQRWSGLRRLGEYGRDIGLFEELAPAHLLDFAGRWLLDEAAGIGTDELCYLLEGLTAFLRWCEESHALPLWTAFGPQLEQLAPELPRLLALRQELPAVASRPGAYRVVRLDGTTAVLAERAGEELQVAVTPAQRRNLREGDVVRVGGSASAPVLAAAYPKELVELLT